MTEPQQQTNTLWTKDFTILTLGSVVSMLGSQLSGFAMSLLVLDLTGSNLLYAVYIATYTLPQIVVPLFSGAILDRFSRRKTIYTLDFLTAGLYLAAAAVLWAGWFSFPVLAGFCFLLGSINGVYMVAYQSFYPMLITPGNYSKAYSVASMLESLTVVMVPVSALIYNAIGIAPLFAINAACYLIAATAETRITAQEAYIDLQAQNATAHERADKRLWSDMKEGFRYLRAERGLLAVACYFFFSSFTGGATAAILLPYFKATYDNGEYLFILVQGAEVAGRALGSVFHYRKKLPVEKKYTIAFGVYVTLGCIWAALLYLPVPVMVILGLLQGVLGVTSYTIRISATQSYVPDEKKGRFNGAFNMLSTVGSFSATLLAGALTTVLPQRTVVVGFAVLEVAMAVLLIGGNRKYIAPIYNREQ